MTSLWCHHANFSGQWVPGNGYDHVAHRAFASLADLRDVIQWKHRSLGDLDRLGIMVHGDEGGLKLWGKDSDKILTPVEIHKAAERRDLLAIGACLGRRATVSFYSCSAGASSRGTQLLCGLSSLWPGRTIVGSVTKGYRFATLTAGDIQDTLMTVIEQLPGSLPPGMPDFYVPGMPGGSAGAFHMPASLPRFLTVPGLRKTAMDGALVDPPAPYSAFDVFERSYPRQTRDLIFDQPAMMIAGSPPLPPRAPDPTRAATSGGRPLPGGERELYLTFLVNFDWPPGYGRNLLARARHVAGPRGGFP